MIAILVAGRITAAPEYKQSPDGRGQVVSSIQARLGRESTEGWQLIARNPPARSALLKLRPGDFAAVQGVPTLRLATIQRETVIQRVLHIEFVLPLRSEGGISDV